MTKRIVAIGATAVAVIFAASACGDSDTGTSSATSSPTSSAITSAEEATAHNEADVLFAQMMLRTTRRRSR